MSSRLEQTMRTGEVSIGAVEGYLAESRPILCGRRQAPLESALMDRTGISARKPTRTAGEVLSSAVAGTAATETGPGDGLDRGRWEGTKKEGAGGPPRERNGTIVVFSYRVAGHQEAARALP